MNGILRKQDSPESSIKLGKPRFGWCTFQLSTFRGRLSDIQDVTDILLNGIEYYMKNDVAAFSFDEEGSEFHVLITPSETYIILVREKQELLKFDINGYDAVLQMLDDIENNIRDWASFGAGGPNKEEYLKARQQNKYELIQKIQQIRALQERRNR